MFKRFFTKPLVSIVIGNKDSLPILKETIQSLKKQTYKNFEVIIIDGKSTDGSLEFLNQQKKYLNLKIISEKDSGISEAYSKGLANVSGDIVGILAADERYYPYTIKQAVKWFKKNPNNIVCGGSCIFLNKNNIEVDKYLDDYLDLERHLTCDHVCAILPSFFNKRLLQNELFYKKSQKTCPDYDLWARLALKYQKDQFKWIDFPIVKALRTEDSMSYRASDFKIMTEDKIGYLKEFLEEYKDDPKLKNTSFEKCAAGIHMWAAEQISYIDSSNEAILYHCNKAYSFSRDYHRIYNFLNKKDMFIENKKKQICKYTKPKKDIEIKSNKFDLKLLDDAELNFTDSKNIKIKTTSSSWGYALQINPFDEIKQIIQKNKNKNYWVKFLLKVEKGVIGIGKEKEGDIIGEQIVKQGENTSLFFKIHEPNFDYPILIRSGGESKSLVTIKEISFGTENI